jgi:branched-chain amino acid transport system substrate-binding protein
MQPKGAWAAEPIKVGIATDLTGPISWGGIPNANVAKMVIEEINKGGGLLGRPLQMILEDTATNEQLAVTKVRKLVTQDKVDVVFGGITSSMRNAIKDTIVNRGKTLLTTCGPIHSTSTPKKSSRPTAAKSSAKSTSQLTIPSTAQRSTRS